MTLILDLTAQVGARAFVRDDVVHLRNRLAGEVYCGAMEPGMDDPGQPMADGATPEEAGLGGDPAAWPWCSECRSLAEAGGLLVEEEDA